MDVVVFYDMYGYGSSRHKKGGRGQFFNFLGAPTILYCKKGIFSRLPLIGA